MIQVQRALGRTIVVRASASFDTRAVLRLQQELSAQLRRLGDPAILITDLRPVAGVDADAARMLVAMLGSPALVLRHVLLAEPDSAGADIASAVVEGRGGRWIVVSNPDELHACLTGLATPAELHVVRYLDADRAAA